MRLRLLFLAVLVTWGAVWFTSHGHWTLGGLTNPFLRRASQWSEPALVRGAGLSADEQNNIDIYKTARLATV